MAEIILPFLVVITGFQAARFLRNYKYRHAALVTASLVISFIAEQLSTSWNFYISWLGYMFIIYIAFYFGIYMSLGEKR